jgi:hypothetical protein
VSVELHNLNWIRNIGIQNSVMLEEYIMLYMALSVVTLSDQSDEIFWRWTFNGIYSADKFYE